MNAYADTAFLCSLHAPDPHTNRVIAWLKRQRQPLPFTGFHRLEFRNALRLRVFRREITPRPSPITRACSQSRQPSSCRNSRPS